MNTITLMKSIQEEHYINICKSYLEYGNETATRHLTGFKGNDIIDENQINLFLLKKFAVSNKHEQNPLVTTIKLYLRYKNIESIDYMINSFPQVKELLVRNYLNNINESLISLIRKRPNCEYEQIDSILTKLDSYYLNVEKNNHSKIKK